MKSRILVIILFAAGSAMAQTKDYSKDVASVDAIIAALYDVITTEPKATPDWDRFKYLFGPDARLVPTRKSPQGELITVSMKPDEYIEGFQARLNTGFYEKELYRVTEQYGTLTHAFSTYETRNTKDGPVTNRGINSIQIFYNGKRYYVTNVFWCAESVGFPLPDKYLGK
jgi:hypothetical protein